MRYINQIIYDWYKLNANESFKQINKDFVLTGIDKNVIIHSSIPNSIATGN